MNSHNKAKIHVWLRLFVFFFLIVGLIILAYKSGFIPTSREEYGIIKNRLHDFLGQLGPYAFLGFIFLQALQVVVAPVPGEVTGFLGGVLYGKGLGIFLSTIGLTLGSLIAFSLSRMLGRPFVERFVKKETMEKYDYLLHHKGAFLVFLLFLVPGFPKDILCYILGLGHLTTKEFFVISTVGRFGSTILLTFGGDYIRHHQYYRFSILLGVAIVVIFFSMVYKDKLARLFRIWHVTSRRKSSKARRDKK